MKIAMPVEDGRLASHFGHARKFAFVLIDDREIRGTEILDPPPHEPGVLPKWLGEQGATHVICGGIGARAVDILVQNGIEVIAGVPSMDPVKAVEAFLAGSIQGVSGPTCDHKHGEGQHRCSH